MTDSLRLAGFDPDEFLEHDWQRRPRLLTGALPGFDSPLSPDELAGLALEDEVESRLVSGDDVFTLEHGPFPEARFAETGDENWTLLVQAVDLWVPEVRAVLDAFDFLPPWRIDDVMISFAAPGGSVGPHFDNYDVFLLQAEGEREWRLGQRCDEDTPLVVESGMKLLAEFEEHSRFVLEPGDILYVPPGIAHWGIARSPCLTYSIGFRSPTLAEMLDDLATELMARGDGRIYRDPPLTTPMASEEIDPAFVDQAKALLRELADDDDLLTDWFARYMTTPRYPALDIDVKRQATTRLGRYVDGERED